MCHELCQEPVAIKVLMELLNGSLWGSGKFGRGTEQRSHNQEVVENPLEPMRICCDLFHTGIVNEPRSAKIASLAKPIIFSQTWLHTGDSKASGMERFESRDTNEKVSIYVVRWIRG